MTALLFISAAIAVVLAWVLVGRRAEHRPIAALLSAGLAGQGALEALDATVLAPLRAVHGVDTAWTGWAALAALAHHAIYLTWPAALVGAALIVFAQRRAWPAALAWALAVALLAIVHPIQGVLASALATADVLSVMVASGLLAAWYRRSMFVTSAHVALATIALAEAASLICAQRIPGWPVSEGFHVVLFLSLTFLAAFHLFRRESDATREELAYLRSELIRQRAELRASTQSQENAALHIEGAIRNTAQHVEGELIRQQGATRAAAKHVEGEIEGAIREFAAHITRELVRQRGMIRGATECNNTTACGESCAAGVEGDRRQHGRQGAADAADEDMQAEIDEHHLEWTPEDEAELAAALRRELPAPPDSDSDPTPWKRRRSRDA